MKSRMNIKSIVIMSIFSIIGLFFINISFAANTAKVSVETANLRETADASSKILELLSLNQEVQIIEKSGDWYKVSVNEITGYLRQDLLSINNENTQETNADVIQEDTQQDVPQEETMEYGQYNIVDDTRLKIVPVINATDIIEVKKGDTVTVTEIINGWACVETQTTKGWIRKDKLQKEDIKIEENIEQEEQKEQVEQPEQTVIKTLFVNSTTVNLRKEPNTSSEILTSLPVNTAVDILAEENGWSKVKVSGREGYISSSLLSETRQESSRSIENTRKAETTTSVATSENASSVVELAQSYIGASYVYGGSSPSGFDCSGFTSYIYKQFGVSLNRTAKEQLKNGVEVSKSELQPGDLVMFGRQNPNVDHVGIYIGGGKMIHAANTARGVTTDTINSGYYYDNYVSARRINN